MNTRIDIDRLLKLYYDGNTTQEQEQQLADYFKSVDDIPDYHKADRDIFLALHSAQPVPPELEEELSSLIDRLDSGEKIVQSIAKRRSRNWIIGIAASIAILFGIGITLIPESSSMNRYECTDQNIACAETEQALILLSQKLNKANKGIDDADMQIGMIKTSLTKTIRNENN